LLQLAGTVAVRLRAVDVCGLGLVQLLMAGAWAAGLPGSSSVSWASSTWVLPGTRLPPVIRRVSSLLTGWETQKAWGATPTLPPELEELLELLELELELELPAPEELDELLLELEDELLDELEDELDDELELLELDELVGIVWVVAVRLTGVEALPLASMARRL
jgi:hypothetical protein